EDAILALLDGRGVQYTTWEGWLKLDAHEKELGEAAGTVETSRGPVVRERIKVVPREHMVAVSRPAGAAALQAGSVL
ncbi:pyridine nucleotide-disulfide oxidoreductase, partial [Arthrobacter sp. GCM10027362]